MTSTAEVLALVNDRHHCDLRVVRSLAGGMLSGAPYQVQSYAGGTLLDLDLSAVQPSVLVDVVSLQRDLAPDSSYNWSSYCAGVVFEEAVSRGSRGYDLTTLAGFTLRAGRPDLATHLLEAALHASGWRVRH